MDYTKEVLDLIREGEEGLNKGLPFSLTSLTNFLGGITKNTQYLIFGKSKSGKSRFGYDQFIYHQLEYLYGLMLNGCPEQELPFDLVILLYTFEIAPVSINLITICRYLFVNGILTHPKYISGKMGKCDKALYDIMYSPEVERFLNFVNSRIKYISRATPTVVWNYTYNTCLALSNEVGKDDVGMPLFAFKNRRLRLHCLIDHASLITTEGTELKKAMDTTSYYFLLLKKMFPISTVILQQINPQDRKDDKELVLPDHENARDTKNTFQDADVTLAIGAPYHLERMTYSYKGDDYYIKPDESNGFVGLEDRFRIIGVQKDREGEANTKTPAGYIGEVGKYVDIPPPNHIYEDGRTIYEAFTFKRTYG